MLDTLLGLLAGLAVVGLRLATAATALGAAAPPGSELPRWRAVRTRLRAGERLAVTRANLTGGPPGDPELAWPTALRGAVVQRYALALRRRGSRLWRRRRAGVVLWSALAALQLLAPDRSDGAAAVAFCALLAVHYAVLPVTQGEVGRRAGRSREAAEQVDAGTPAGVLAERWSSRPVRRHPESNLHPRPE